MEKSKVPVVPIPDNLTFEEVPDLLEVVGQTLEKKGLLTLPVFIFAVCDAPKWPQDEPKLSPRPERALIVCLDQSARDSVMASLREVEKREPIPTQRQKAPKVTIKPNTPLRSIYKQMAAAPVTVFSMSFAPEMDTAFFFLRTAFTISELEAELPKHSLGSNNPSNN